VWIVPAHGPQIPFTSHCDSSDPRLLIVTLPDDLAAGPVVIGYHILSVDGHVVDAQLTFTIKNMQRSAPPAGGVQPGTARTSIISNSRGSALCPARRRNSPGSKTGFISPRWPT